MQEPKEEPVVRVLSADEILPNLYLVTPVISENVTLEFRYYESEDVSFSKTVVLDGSYASLGQYPHWCVGNISLCHGGIAVDLWVNFKNVSEDTPEIIVFSTGGHSLYSNGWYLWQKYGHEFEFGIALYGDSWSVNFLLVPGYWCHLFASWKAEEGLRVYVDDALFTNLQAQKRDYEGLEFDPFPYVALGIDVNGRPHTQDSRFLVRKLFIYNQTTPDTRPPTDVESNDANTMSIVAI
ncbi:hypothetical protein CHS0354_004035 [Potamilus streckersoni]|uniref:Uncharacterized protein n=1 Tax=Potamilus streckersoni TaxID=2493646 RepID=A0AAE0VW84_9BIVA|nr:hypothetical protein CHS0354_004035 [Potamilus streckersoni]